MCQVFLGIGGNSGNRQLNFENVHIAIEKSLGKITAESSVYETEPWGFEAEENFWNQVLCIEADLTPDELLTEIHRIEEQFGRVRESGKYLSREMDIDILFYNDLILSTENLIIPHPHIEKRLFVLAPLTEIAPGFVHPVLKKTTRQLLDECPDKSFIRKLKPMENRNKQPKIDVGIVSRKELRFFLSSDFWNNNKRFSAGEYIATVEKNQISIISELGEKHIGNTILLVPGKNSFFELKDVTIGIGFHWEQDENQRFRGTLKLIPDEGKVLAINSIEMEEYLKSVISSEMNASASLEFLKAHAVISRSWLLAQMEKTKSLKAGGGIYQTTRETKDEIIRWYDREDHSLFDVCADDHCQRYQGITKIFSEKAVKAVEETFGEALFHNGKICDTRFSKCCGGISESFENVWEPVHHGYLTKVYDSDSNPETLPNLQSESEAEQWILNNPPVFCNTTNPEVLGQILPDFDQKTISFFRWKVEYTQQELTNLIWEKSGIDFGAILKLEPLERGDSARIIRLKIHGTKRTVIVGKELEIRKWLSESHLYSSAFVVEYPEMIDDIPQKFVLTGSGWGHGVGLCQIGAAVMGEKGFSYAEILNHYFKGAKLKKSYD